MNLTVGEIELQQRESEPDFGAASSFRAQAAEPPSHMVGETSTTPRRARTFRLNWPARLAMNVRDGLWVTLAVLTPIVSYVGNLAFAPLVALAGIACLPLIPHTRRFSAGMALLSVLLVWGLISQIWSPYHLPDPSFTRGRDLQQMTGLKLVFLLALTGSLVASGPAIRRDAAARGLTCLAVGFALLVAVLLVESFNGQAIYAALKTSAHLATRPDLLRRNVARACYTLALLAWPVALHLWSKGQVWRAVAVATLLGTVATSIFLQVDSPIVAVLLGGVAMLAVQRLGRTATNLAVLAIILYFVLAPLVVSEFGASGHAVLATGVAKTSWGSRLEIWRFVSGLVENKPLFGWGLDSSRVFPGLIPLHPHNAAVQIWFELGAVGAGVAAIFFVWMISQVELIRRRDPALAGAAAATMCAYLAIGGLSFGVWQEWWLALGALGALVIMALDATRLQRAVTARDAFSMLLPL